VIREQRKEEIKRMIEERFGAQPGSSAMFQHYQKMLAEVMKSLSPAEIVAAESTAATWNLQGATTEAKTR
jgi:hypothetical protein